jgi:hypothetical protein
MPIISGRDFNESNEKRVVKLLTANWIHNGYKYKIGLNVLNGKFNPNPHCLPGALYCTRKPNEWLDYGGKKMVVKCDVVFPDDAKIVLMKNKIKCDKFILYNPTKIFDKKQLSIADGSGGAGKNENNGTRRR